MATPEQPARAARVLDDLYRRHAAEVFRYTYAVLGNRADAEDVTQATFVNALRALERGEQPRKAANWLLAIAHNLMRQRFRQERARPTQVLLDGDLPQAAIAEEDDSAPSVGELVGALGRIPVSQREAIVMREFEGRSYAEIAEILGVTTSALETLLFRARRSLAEELDNLVTCARAEQDVSRLLDGRLSRRERKRLQEHVRTCPACARFEAFQRKQRRALKGLAVLPLPASLVLFKGVHGASAAALPTIGAGTAATAAAGGAASGGATFGGLALGGVATKAAVVLAAVAAAGGVSYEGATLLDNGPQHPTPAHGAPSAGRSTRAVVAERKAGAAANRHGARAHHPSATRARSNAARARRHSGSRAPGAAMNHSKAGKAVPIGHVKTPATGANRSTGSPANNTRSGQGKRVKSTTTAKQTSTTVPPSTPSTGGTTGGNSGTSGNQSDADTGTTSGSTPTVTTVTTTPAGGNGNGVTSGAGGGAAKGNGK